MGLFGKSSGSSSSSSSASPSVNPTSRPAPSAPRSVAPAPRPARPQNAGPNVAQMARAMENEKQRKRAEELAELEPGALYLTLYFRAGLNDNFHWGLYHHVDHQVGGWKYHITGHGSHWTTDNKITTGALASLLLIGLVYLKNLGADDSDIRKVHEVVTAEDDQLSRIPGLRCRLYVQRACERLKEANLLSFPDWNTLQAEVEAFGNEHNPEVRGNDTPKPRPVTRSRVVT